MTKKIQIPKGAIKKGGKIYNHAGRMIELYQGRWRVVKHGDRDGWWRFNEHYDRDGYCDNPGRGY
jgi:hypothetical protein